MSKKKPSPAIAWLIAAITCIVLFVLSQLTPGPSITSFPISSGATMVVSKDIPFAGILTGFLACLVIIRAFRQRNSSSLFWELQIYIWLFSCAITYVLTHDSFIMFYGLPLPGYDYWFIFPLILSILLSVLWKYAKAPITTKAENFQSYPKEQRYEQGYLVSSKQSRETRKAPYIHEYEMPQTSYPLEQHMPEQK